MSFTTVEYKYKLFGFFEVIDLETLRTSVRKYFLGVYRTADLAEKALYNLRYVHDSAFVGGNSDKLSSDPKARGVLVKRRTRARPIRAIQSDGRETEEHFLNGWIVPTDTTISYRNKEEGEENEEQSRT